MKHIAVTISGTVPLMMHNERLANPLDPIVKEIKKITGKRVKTDEDYQELSWLEFQGGLYWTKIDGTHIPAKCILAAIRDGAGISRKGRSIQRGVTMVELVAPLVYEGPQDPKAMYTAGLYDMRAVSAQGKKGGSRTIRTRPMFLPPWSCTFTLTCDPQVFNLEELRESVDAAGRLIGLCDYRPMYGKFEITDWSNGG